MSSFPLFRRLSVLVFLLWAGISFGQTSNYLVLSSENDTNTAYYQAAHILAEYRNAQLLHFDPSHVQLLLPTLYSLSPRYVAVVVRPSELDINFVRDFLMMSTKVDTDPFTDFSYGFITGATGADAIYFVNNIISNFVQFSLKLASHRNLHPMKIQ